MDRGPYESYLKKLTDPQCSKSADNDRFDCHPEPNANPQKCVARGCCWKSASANFDPEASYNVPWCFFPSDYAGYSTDEIVVTSTGYAATLTATGQWQLPYGTRIGLLRFELFMPTVDSIRFKFYDPANKRYEVPISTPEIQKKAFKTNYHIDFTKNPFSVKITRKSTGAVLFDSSPSPLIFTDQFLLISTLLSSSNLYGLGEQKAPLQKGGAWARYSLWARDQSPTFNTNIYGSHPFFLNLEPDGKAHGVFLLNSNAMDVDISPKPAVTFRTIGGILDFFVFLGPSADAVISQYTDVIGKPFMPPYWSLGFHLCRYGYSDTAYVKKIIERNRAIGIPYDVQWTDIDYMDAKFDWTYDPKRYGDLPSVVEDLHEHGQKYIMIIDPGIANTQPGKYAAYDEGVKDGVFIQDSKGNLLIGKVWPGTVTFPDFYHPNATKWWTKQAQDWHTKVSYDGIWIDMNEPSNFVFGSTVGCPGNHLDNPPYVPQISGNGSLADNTVCPSALHYSTSHYNLHNLYGLSETMATASAVTSVIKKRSIIISRSTFPSQGHFGGHWTGDVFSTWEDLHYSIPAMLEFGMYGIPLVGADICGFNHDTTEELCTRWMQLGAFYPFMRNHNTLGAPDQDPAAFSKRAQSIMKAILEVRYTLLPFLYTLMVNSHMTGVPAARPLFFSFPTDVNTFDIDKQFMWGSSLIISPVLTQGAESVEAYLPKGIWYDLYTSQMIGSTGKMIGLPAPLEKIPVHIRGGSILPLQAPAVTTTLSRKNPFGLIAAYDVNGSASGELFWDDGDSLDSYSADKFCHVAFSAAQGTLTSVIMKNGYAPESPLVITEIRVLGVAMKPTHAEVNGQSAKVTYLDHLLELEIADFSADLLSPLRVTWK
ncbi:hypothetical protein CAPTEDRAFT_167453 [Capitella teleta]|uniref:P-type domain-containing protein n=1 Tax=Capitella teleta TaxID=283909 RepID=R7V9X3_CAPTE|nr:hypothetical protein CAPTEDRAFT_167453 [Capitella teleta]|eukprot:ELU15628.1 hypothetical protein CAPTEDRAFT_167453 [Capitella teleta]